MFCPAVDVIVKKLVAVTKFHGKLVIRKFGGCATFSFSLLSALGVTEVSVII